MKMMNLGLLAGMISATNKQAITNIGPVCRPLKKGPTNEVKHKRKAQRKARKLTRHNR